MKRGVMMPPFRSSKRNGKTNFYTYGDSTFLDAAPAAVLYWDKIYAPVAFRGMAPQYDSAVDRLVTLGIAESVDLKPSNSFSPSDIAPMILSYANSLGELNSRPSETWSVMPMSPSRRSTLSEQSSLYLPKSSETVASIEVKLKNALPVPDRDAPYEDLLEFRVRRNDQIQNLHAELTQVASRYVGAMEEEKALLAALQDVNSAVSELRRVYQEKWSVKVTKSLTSAFALEGVLPAGGVYLAGQTLDTAFFAGAAAMIVKSSVSAALPAINKDNPYSYALEAQNM